MTFGIRFTALVAVFIGLLALPALASAHGGGTADFSPGASGAGDPYFPLDGNGGYDVAHYLARRDVRPGHGRARREGDDHGARDAGPLQLQPRPRRADRAVGPVDGRSASWTRDEHELTITPRKGIRDGRRFIVVDPLRRRSPSRSWSGSASRASSHTDDGALVVGAAARGGDLVPGQRPSDATRRPTPSRSPCLDGLEAIANGELEGQLDEARLDDLALGREGADGLVPDDGDDRRVRPHAYKKNGIRFWDAVDPDLYEPPAAPRTGEPVRHLAAGRAVLQAARAHDRRARRRRDALLLGHPRHRDELGLPLRRGAHGRARTTGRPCPT